MKYCRFIFDKRALYGKVEERAGEPWITDLAEAPEEDLSFRLAQAQAASWSFDFEPMPLGTAELLEPITPSKIVCIGRNYRDHVREMGNDLPAEPLIFLKAPSALLRPGGVVKMPALSARVDYEGELAVVVGRRASKIEPGAWRDYVRGYTLANDVTARDLQNKDGQWSRAKGFDTFCPVGPFVSDEIDPQAGLTIETRQNGELRQSGSTKDLIFAIPELLAYITAAITLEPGDLLLTGTPAGVGPVNLGDQVEVSAAGLGVLFNRFSTE